MRTEQHAAVLRCNPQLTLIHWQGAIVVIAAAALVVPVVALASGATCHSMHTADPQPGNVMPVMLCSDGEKAFPHWQVAAVVVASLSSTLAVVAAVLASRHAAHNANIQTPGSGILFFSIICAAASLLLWSLHSMQHSLCCQWWC